VGQGELIDRDIFAAFSAAERAPWWFAARRSILMRARAVEGLPLAALMVSHFMSRLYPIVRAVRAISRRRGRAAGVSGIDLSYPPAPVNALLREVFAGAGARLPGVLRGDRRPYPFGVSLLGAYRRA